jgi:hypothetical protein
MISRIKNIESFKRSWLRSRGVNTYSVWRNKRPAMKPRKRTNINKRYRSTPLRSTPLRSTPPRSTPPRSTPPRSTPPRSTPRRSTPPTNQHNAVIQKGTQQQVEQQKFRSLKAQLFNPKGYRKFLRDKKLAKQTTSGSESELDSELDSVLESQSESQSELESELESSHYGHEHVPIDGYTSLIHDHGMCQPMYAGKDINSKIDCIPNDSNHAIPSWVNEELNKGFLYYTSTRSSKDGFFKDIRELEGYRPGLQFKALPKGLRHEDLGVGYPVMFPRGKSRDFYRYLDRYQKKLRPSRPKSPSLRIANRLTRARPSSSYEDLQANPQKNEERLTRARPSSSYEDLQANPQKNEERYKAAIENQTNNLRTNLGLDPDSTKIFQKYTQNLRSSLLSSLLKKQPRPTSLSRRINPTKAKASNFSPSRIRHLQQRVSSYRPRRATAFKSRVFDRQREQSYQSSKAQDLTDSDAENSEDENLQQNLPVESNTVVNEDPPSNTRRMIFGNSPSPYYKAQMRKEYTGEQRKESFESIYQGVIWKGRVGENLRHNVNQNLQTGQIFEPMKSILKRWEEGEILRIRRRVGSTYKTYWVNKGEPLFSSETIARYEEGLY